MEIDGFNETDNIVVIAATNRIHVIDEALMRSGRFDIKIQVRLPDQEERLGILKIHLKKVNKLIQILYEEKKSMFRRNFIKYCLLK